MADDLAWEAVVFVVIGVSGQGHVGCLSWKSMGSEWGGRKVIMPRLSRTGEAGKGAAIGAATGGLFGGMRRAERSAQQQQYQMSGQDAYNRALTACMNGRGYTVQ